MNKTATILILFSLYTSTLFSQAYRTAAGLRLGTGEGAGVALTVQQLISKGTTIEGIFQPSFNGSDAALDLIYEKHNKILFRRFNIYSGGGIHKVWRADNTENQSKADFGLVGILGGEMTFKKISVSWDYKPAMNLLGGSTNFSHQSAISVRMILVKQKKRKINWKFWKKKEKKKRKWF